MNPAEYEAMYRLEERHWYFRGKRRIVRRLLQPHLKSVPLTILDAGCGTGGILADLGSLGTVTAMDPFHEAALFCARRDFTRLVQGSVAKLPFSEGTFDLVTSLDVIEHVDDDLAALKEMYRVLKPGGLLLLTVPAHMFLWSGHDVALHHKRRYDEPGLLDRIHSAGFCVKRCTSFNSILFPLVALARGARRLLGMDRAQSDSSSLPPLGINSFLYRIMHLEAYLLGHINFPVGVSLACLAQKERVC